MPPLPIDGKHMTNACCSAPCIIPKGHSLSADASVSVWFFCACFAAVRSVCLVNSAWPTVTKHTGRSVVYYSQGYYRLTANHDRPYLRVPDAYIIHFGFRRRCLPASVMCVCNGRYISCWPMLTGVLGGFLLLLNDLDSGHECSFYLGRRSNVCCRLGSEAPD